MTTATSIDQTLASTIRRALEKIQAKKETEVCKYLPGDGTGHLHHLSYRHLKNRDPQSVQNLLQTHILNKQSPQRLASPPRAPRSPSSKSSMKLSRDELAKIVRRLQELGDTQLVPELRPRVESKKQVKKDLISAIKRDQADQGLWEAFTRMVTE